MKLQKVTDVAGDPSAPREHGRWYDDACGAAFGMELLGERWALLIVRELMFGGRRFGDLRKGLPGISARVLGERLAGLEANGIVRRAVVEGAQVYELTAWGLAADEAMLALCRWSLASPARDHTLPLSAAGMLMSLRALFDGGAAAGVVLAAEIRIGAEEFAVMVDGARLRVGRGAADAPDFALAAAGSAPLKRLIYGRAPLEEVEPMGLTCEGDRAAVARFARCFVYPAKAL